MTSNRIALFDLDGTVTRYDTYLAYLLGFLRRNPHRLPRAVWLPAAVCAFHLGYRNNEWLKTAFLRSVLGGVDRVTAQAWTNAFVDRVVQSGVRRRVRRVLRSHREAGDKTLLLTASLDIYVEHLSARLGFDAVICSRVEWSDRELLTGSLSGANCYGPVKLERARAYLEDLHPETRITAYSDHHSDLELLRWAHNPVAVHPTPALRRAALRHNIPIELWD